LVRGGEDVKGRGAADDKEEYMRWLKEMWDAHKLDTRSDITTEERRMEEVLETLEALGEELADQHVQLPHSPSWEKQHAASDQEDEGHAKSQ
jgi:hypothetical protein